MNIYIYELENQKGLYKLGQTKRNVEERIREQVGHLPIKYNILFKENIEGITDYDILSYLKDKGIISSFRNEWFRCDYNVLIRAIEECKKKAKPYKKHYIRNFFIKLFLTLINIKINLRSKKDILLKSILFPFYYLKELFNLRNEIFNQRLFKKIKKEMWEDFTGFFKRRKTNSFYLILFLSLLIFLTLYLSKIYY